MLFLIEERGPSPLPHFYLEITVLVDGYGGRNYYISASLSIPGLTSQFPVTLHVLFATSATELIEAP